MFDLFLGLPLHPLMVHSFVVLAPLAALLVIVYALAPRLRRGLRWPTLVAALVVGVIAIVTRQSGEAFRDRLFPLLASGGPTPAVESVWVHTQLAGAAGIITAVWALGVIIVVWFFVSPLPRPTHADAHPRRRWTLAEIIGVSLLGLSSIVVIVWAIIAGHTGATATWGAVPGIA